MEITGKCGDGADREREDVSSRHFARRVDGCARVSTRLWFRGSTGLGRSLNTEP